MIYEQICGILYKDERKKTEVMRLAAKKKKRTLSPEQLAKMQAGRERAKKHRERVADAEALEHRMEKAAREAAKPVRIRGRKGRKYIV